jgi:peptidoglycan/xylan/chitin deacetylase (PgdA/CDA1 family)
MAPTAVLMYHRVAPEARDLQGLRVRDDRFREHLEVMRRHADVVPLAEVLARSTRPRVVVTFDDGYADNLYIAEPILVRAGVPATVFVTAGVIESERGFWQDRLAALILDGVYTAGRVEVTIGGETVGGPLSSPDEREQAYRAIHARTRRRPPDEIDAVLTDVAAQLDLVEDVENPAPVLTVADVKKIAMSTVMTVGSHTLRHPMLSSLDEAAQRSEIFESKRLLEHWTAGSVDTFAYPFGREGQFDETSVRLVREAGYGLSVTTVAGRPSRFTDAHRVPRRYVGDWDADVFERRLADWLAP